MSDTAHAVRSLRLERAWSQEQLGTIAGISARTIQRLEQGQRPSLETLKALAAAFDVPVSRLNPERSTSEDSPMTSIPDNSSSRRSFRRQLVLYAGVIGGLAILNLLRHPEHLWVIYPALGWGIPLAVKGFRLSRKPNAPA